MLGEKIAQAQRAGVAGEHRLDRRAHGVGSRMKIAHTRAMITAALSGAARQRRATRTHPVFNLDVPTSCPGVPPTCSIREARGRTRPPTTSRRAKLGAMFVENFKTFETDVPPAVKEAGPSRTGTRIDIIRFPCRRSVRELNRNTNREVRTYEV